MLFAGRTDADGEMEVQLQNDDEHIETVTYIDASEAQDIIYHLRSIFPDIT